MPRPHHCPRKCRSGGTAAWGPPCDAEEVRLHAVEAAVLCLHAVEAAVLRQCIVREGEEVHRAILAAEREQGGRRVGGNAPDGAALR